MPQEIQELSLEDAAAELATPRPSKLDDRGFRVDDSETTEKPKKYSSVLDDDEDDGTEEISSTVEDDPDDVGVEEEDEDNDSDEQDDPVDSTIEAPKSFTYEEQQEFKKLPPKVQETLARRESERDRAVMTRMNQIAEDKQQLQPLAERLKHDQNAFVQMTELVAQMGLPEVNDFEGVDWVTLARNDPALYTEKRARYEDLQRKLQVIGNTVQQVKQQQAQQYQTYYQQTVNDQLNQLLEVVPAFRDKTKASAMVNDMTHTLQEYGFQADDLNQIVDHRVVRILADFSKMKVAEQTRQSALKKKSAQPAPRVMQSSGSTNGRTENRNAKVKQAWDKLGKSGDIWDAVRVMNLKG